MITIKGKGYILIFFISAIILSSRIGTYASSPVLPDCFTQIGLPVGTSMPFNPEHKYSCMQNPPDFSWPMVTGAQSYDVIVCSDEQLTDIVYSESNIENHYYNFKYVFEPGTYYWAVRAVNADGCSGWSAARRFRIDPDYTKFTPPASEDIVSRVPESHPRIWMTQDTADDFCNIKNSENGKKIFDMMLSKNSEHMSSVNPSDPTDITTAAETAINMGFRCQLAALCYILTGDTDIADYAVASMLEISSWDSENNATSFNGNDQAFFEVLSRISMAYDWMYNYMSEQERSAVRTMLEKRFDTVKQYSLDILRKNPYNSHIWSYFGNYGIACMALVHDVEGVDEYFRQMLDLYLSNLVPMSTEDGGWSKGTAYWTYAFTRDKQFMDILALGGYVNCYDKAWARNEYLWAMYMMPSGSYGSFGDASGIEKAGINNVMGLSKLGKFTENKIAYWLRNQIGTINQLRGSNIDAYLYADTVGEEGEAPYSYPNAHVFTDQGMAAMHSSVTDDERISLYFRSGSYGSYNHMHADQNSFIIEAFGEKLASKSGYYDSYHSTHDTNFTRKTFAHNSVTYDGGIGQTDDDLNAKGNIDMFITHHDFDAAVGEAAEAYGGGLDKFERSIIYLRPDVYIVIDDLKAAEGERHQFEWRLNAPTGTLSKLGDGRAVVENGNAVLDVQVVYPSVSTSEVIQSFEAPDGNLYPPKGAYEGCDAQDRMCFTTSETESTKIITVMQVHKSDAKSKVYDMTAGDGFITLTFRDGTSAIISTSDEAGKISAQDMTFRGNAVVFNDSTVMLVGGDTLEIDGGTVISSDRKISAVIGKSLVGISSGDDANVSLGMSARYLPVGISQDSITDSRGRALSPLIGIEAQPSDGMLNLKMQKGHYSLYMSEKAVSNPNELIPKDVRVIRDKEGTDARVYWDIDPKAYSYDICINGELIENVSMPYIFAADSDKSYEVGVRAVGSAGASSMSASVYLNPRRVIDVSHVKFVFADSTGLKVSSPQQGGTVSAEAAMYNAGGSSIALILAKYRDGRLMQISSQRANQHIPGSYEKISAGVLSVDDSEEKFRAFIWSTDRLEPFAPAASDVQVSARLSAISIDGKELEGFSPDTLQYSAALDESGQMPVVKGTAEDNSAYVTCEYNVLKTQALAKITVKTPEGAQNEYTVSFYLPEGCAQAEIIPPVSDFEQITAGMSYSDYCRYAGVAPNEDETSEVTIVPYIKLGVFKVGENLCGATAQRKITGVNELSGFENCYFVAPDPSLYQLGSSAPWIVSAFTGSVQTGTNGVIHDFGGLSVPWVRFKVNRACEVMVLSDSEPSFCNAGNGWIHTELEDELYEATRTRGTSVTKVAAFMNMYTKSFSAGDTVELYNENCSMNKDIPYLTIIRFY